MGDGEGSRPSTGRGGWPGQRCQDPVAEALELTLLYPSQHHREEWPPERGARCLPLHPSAQSPVSGPGWAGRVGGHPDVGS